MLQVRRALQPPPPPAVRVNASAPSVAPPSALAADSSNHVIRAIVLATRNTSTLAGAGAPGWADGTGTASRFNTPSACAVDSANTYMYVSDTNNGAIRLISLSSGSVTTIIGKGCTSSAASCIGGNDASGCCLFGLASRPCSSDFALCYLPGNSGTSASFYAAQSLALSYASPCSSISGCLWVTSQLGTLNVVDLSSSPATMTMAACIDPAGTSCASCTSSGGCAAYSYVQVQGVALDSASPPNILVALRSFFAVWQCTPAGTLSGLASCSRDVGQGVGYQYVQDTSATDNGGTVSNIGSAGSWRDESVGLPLSAGFISPWGLAFDASAASLFVADQNVVRMSNFVSGNPENVITVAGGNGKSLPGVAGPNYPNHWLPPAPANIYVPSPGLINGVGTNTAFFSPSNIVAAPATRMLYIADRCGPAARRRRQRPPPLAASACSPPPASRPAPCQPRGAARTTSFVR